MAQLRLSAIFCLLEELPRGDCSLCGIGLWYMLNGTCLIVHPLPSRGFTSYITRIMLAQKSINHKALSRDRNAVILEWEDIRRITEATHVFTILG